MSPASTPGLLQDPDPRSWSGHHFGLPADRWKSLGGRTFWITGAGTGYGRCIALALAAAGARVFLTGRRRERLEEVRSEAAALGIDARLCMPLPADLTRPGEVADAAAAIARDAGGLHGLVNNAALPEPRAGTSPLAELDVERWSALLATNVTGQWLATRAALPLMTRGSLRIVFMTSEAGWAFTPGFGPYNASKAAVNSLGASFAAECAARSSGGDVQINVLVPGEARTEMNQGSDVSPWTVVPMTLLLLSHPVGGPNGCFFHRDGRHLEFGYARPHGRSLLEETVGGLAARIKRLLRARGPQRRMAR